jgi:hypothetical protein
MPNRNDDSETMLIWYKKMMACTGKFSIRLVEERKERGHVQTGPSARPTTYRRLCYFDRNLHRHHILVELLVVPNNLSCWQRCSRRWSCHSLNDGNLLDPVELHVHLEHVGIVVDDDHLHIEFQNQHGLAAGNCWHDDRPFPTVHAVTMKLAHTHKPVDTMVIPADTADTENTLLAVALVLSFAARRPELGVVAAAWLAQRCQFEFADAFAEPWRDTNT